MDPIWTIYIICEYVYTGSTCSEVQRTWYTYVLQTGSNNRIRIKRSCGTPCATGRNLVAALQLPALAQATSCCWKQVSLLLQSEQSTKQTKFIFYTHGSSDPFGIYCHHFFIRLCSHMFVRRSHVVSFMFSGRHDSDITQNSGPILGMGTKTWVRT